MCEHPEKAKIWLKQRNNQPQKFGETSQFLYNFSSWVPKNLHATFELPTQLTSGSNLCGGGARDDMVRCQRLYGVESEFSVSSELSFN